MEGGTFFPERGGNVPFAFWGGLGTCYGGGADARIGKRAKRAVFAGRKRLRGAGAVKLRVWWPMKGTYGVAGSGGERGVGRGRRGGQQQTQARLE